MAQEFMNNCLVCGESQTGKSTLLNKLIANIKWSNVTNDNKIKTCQWQPSNKYYTANINFIVINSIDSIANVPNSNTQALLLFINLNQSKEQIKDDIHSWNNAICKHFGRNEIDSQFLLGNYVSNSSNYSSKTSDFKTLHDELNVWCVENQFEFVPSPFMPNIGNNSNDEMKENSENENKMDGKTNSVDFSIESAIFSNYDEIEMGTMRIDSALQCVMWPDMQRNPPNRPTNSLINNNANNETQNISKPLTSQDRVSGETDEKTSYITNENTANSINSTQPDTGSNEEKSEINRINGALHELKNEEIVDTLIMEKMRNDIKNSKDTNNTNSTNGAIATTSDKNDETANIGDSRVANALNSISSSEMNGNNGNNNKNGSDLETSMSSFQSIVDEMRSVREASKSGNLSHEERRERAAKTAMKLASMFGLEDASDDEINELANLANKTNKTNDSKINNNNNINKSNAATNNSDSATEGISSAINGVNGTNGLGGEEKELTIVVPYAPGKHPAHLNHRAQKIVSAKASDAGKGNSSVVTNTHDSGDVNVSSDMNSKNDKKRTGGQDGSDMVDID